MVRTSGRVAARLAVAAAIGAWLSGGAFAELLKQGGNSGASNSAPMTFEADEVEYNDQLALTIAKGHVEVSQGGQILIARCRHL